MYPFLLLVPLIERGFGSFDVTLLGVVRAWTPICVLHTSGRNVFTGCLIQTTEQTLTPSGGVMCPKYPLPGPRINAYRLAMLSTMQAADGCACSVLQGVTVLATPLFWLQQVAVLAVTFGTRYAFRASLPHACTAMLARMALLVASHDPYIPSNRNNICFLPAGLWTARCAPCSTPTTTWCVCALRHRHEGSHRGTRNLLSASFIARHFK